MCVPHTKAWDRRLYWLSLFVSLACFVFHYGLFYPMMVTSLTHLAANENFHDLHQVQVEPEVLYKWYAASDAMDEMNALQDYILALGRKDGREPGNIYLSAALNLSSPGTAQSASGVGDLRAFMVALPTYFSMPSTNVPVSWFFLASNISASIDVHWSWHAPPPPVTLWLSTSLRGGTKKKNSRACGGLVRRCQ